METPPARPANGEEAEAPATPEPSPEAAPAPDEPAPETPPETAPVPAPEPAPAERQDEALPDAEDAPVPSPAPESEQTEVSPPAAEDTPVPAERPEEPKPAPEQEPMSPPTPPVASPPPPAQGAKAGPMGEEELACRARLRALGTVFEDRPAEADVEAGCSLPYPVWVTRLGPGVALEPGALLNCRTAEAATRFSVGTLEPLAREVMKTDLKGIGQASAYVCRPRHGTETLSEHAFGNALDMAQFSFADGSTLVVSPEVSETGQRFFDETRKRACGAFKTVLGPGSDADHANHLHFDLAERNNGATFCQ
ncbi:MAG: extensin family protein [Mesorhizobium amorphae]|nr:MAG: extensin family protein [Mesorhizobium amorphae]